MIKFSDLLSGLVRLHVLHQAAEQEISSKWIFDDLARYGYRLSPGPFCRMLQSMERAGYIVSREERRGLSVLRFYRITDKGQEALALARKRVREFVGETMRK